MTTNANKPLAVVNLGYHLHLLLPQDKALKFVELLSHALVVEADYAGGGRNNYLVKETPEAILETVKAAQLKFPNGHQPEPTKRGKALPLHQLRLGGPAR